MGGDPGATTSALLARVRSQVVDAQRLIGRAHHRARDQDEWAHAVRRRTRQRVGCTVDRWSRAHRLASLTDRREHDEALGLVLEAARRLFGHCRSVSLATVDQLEDPRRPYRTAASSGVAATVDAAQFRLGEGPCVDALELDIGAVIRVDDLTAGAAASEWPSFDEAAAALGVRSVLSVSLPWNAGQVGLHAERHALGAITFYAGEDHAFAQSEIYALLFGAWAGSLVTGVAPGEFCHADFPP